MDAVGDTSTHPSPPTHPATHVHHRGVTGAFEVSVVRSYGPSELLHSKKTGRGQGLANTPAEREAIVARLRAVLAEERGG